MEAPERIWAFLDGPMVGMFVSGGHTGHGVEYVRADLPPTLTEALRCSEVASAAEALRDMIALAHQLGALDLETEEARDALAAIEKGR